MKNSSSYGQRLTIALRERNMSQSELARRIGVTPQAIQALCKKDKGGSSHTTAIASELFVNPSWLDTGKGQMGAIVDDKILSSAINVPIIDWELAERYDPYNLTDEDKTHIESYAKWVVEGLSDHAFLLRMINDSMTDPEGRPSIPQGWFMLVDPKADPAKLYYVHSARNGTTAVVARKRNGGSIFIKRYNIDGDTVFLDSLNPRYLSFPLDDTIEIIGTVINVIMIQ